MTADDLDNELREQFESLREKVRRHCFRMLGNTENAEDATQDALVNAWNRRSTYRKDSPIEHWIMRIATNACLDLARRKRSKVTDDLDETRLAHVGRQDPGLFKVELLILLDQVLPPLRECMGNQNFWIWQNKTRGVTEEQIVNRLPPKWKLSKDGVHSRVQRNIKVCLEKIRLLFGKELALLQI